MNKIKQNKITFILILAAIVIIFSSLTILCLPVLFNYKSKVTILEKNFYNNFKIYLKSSGDVSYKPFPRPHILVEKASINLTQPRVIDDLINTSNLKIFISLRDIYLRTFNNFLSAEISKTNLYFNFSDIKKIRNHLYQKINKPIIFNNCKIFINSKEKEVILISPIKKISYSINNKSKIKNFDIEGKIFGLNFKSQWKRSYDIPNQSVHSINIFNPNIEIKNIFQFKENEKFKAYTKIIYEQDKLEHDLEFNKNKIQIISKNKNDTNFNLDGNIQLKPFYFDGGVVIKNKKVENIIDNFLVNLLMYDKNYLGNLSGVFEVKLKKLNNKLIKSGELQIDINERVLILKKAKFQLGKIGNIESNISFVEDQGELRFLSKNYLNIENHIEFAKVFQIGTKKIKNIKQIYFDLDKNVGETDFIIKNVKINNLETQNSGEFLVKNIQNLRSFIRKVID